jgi:streptogramin lyase
MTSARVLGLLLILLALLAGQAQGGSRDARVVSQGSVPSGGCRQVGTIDHAFPGRGASLQLDRSSKGCKCPAKCTDVTKNQSLFAAESIISGAQTIVIKSAARGSLTFTCRVTHRATDVIYPKAAHVGSGGGVAALQVLAGATTCRVEDGPFRRTKKPNAVFVIGNTEITIEGDPVFGMKKTSQGSLVQVRKGTVAVGTTNRAARVAVRPKTQVWVGRGATKPGAVTALKPDATLQKQLCELTPVLKETDVLPAVGGNAGSHPQGLAPDQDGNIWFTDDGTTPAVGRYDLQTGKVTETTAGLKPGDIPRWVAPDAAGIVWFTVDGPKPAIAALDPKTRVITQYTKGLSSGSIPWAIVSNPADNRIWFTDQSRTLPAIGSIDPKTGAITEFRAGLRIGSHPQGIDVDRKGNLWFTDDNDPAPAIGTIDRTTHEIHEYSNGLVPGSLPRGIAAGPDGKLWFADERTRPPHNSAPHAPGDGLIGAIDPATKAIVEYSVEANGGNPGSIPEGLAADTNGHVWFTDDGATKAIGMIDPVTGAVSESKLKLAANSEPIGIVVVDTGLWFTDQHPTPRIGRIKSLPSC